MRREGWVVTDNREMTPCGELEMTEAQVIPANPDNEYGPEGTWTGGENGVLSSSKGRL
jgi:hypothetical protein